MPDLIRTKIQRPPVPPNHIARPHLFERLNIIHAPKLILVSAPAGFGKSSIISAWVQQCEQAVAWLALDASDNDPARFWSYLLAALQSAGVNLTDGVYQTIGTGSEEVATVLINELVNRAEPLTIVLDDYHLIAERSIHNALGLLLDHMPEGVTLVIIARADPPFALGRLRARGQMVELRAADLRFISGEVATFLQNAMRLSLDANDMAILESRTEGWPAGLQLAALALRGHADPATFIREFAGSHHYIVEYLTEEVTHQQPEDVQRFLLETAHLDRLSVPLCDAVTGRHNSAQMIEHLREHNLFLIALDATQTWHRYHHLFAELLRHRQRQMLQASQVRDLHRQAGMWHTAANHISEAVEYALAGEIYQDAARLLEDNWQHVQHRGELSTMRRWLVSLPPDIMPGNPVLHMAACWMHHLSGNSEAVEPELTLVRETWQASVAANPIPNRNAWIVIPSLTESMSAIVALNRGQYQAVIDHAQQALDAIPDSLAPEYKALLTGAASYRLAQAHHALGQTETAITVMRDVLEHLKRGNNIIGLVRGTDAIVKMHLALGDYHTGQAICDDMLAHLTQQGYQRLPLTGLIHLVMAEIAVYVNKLEQAHHHLELAVQLAAKSSYPGLAERIETLQTQINSSSSNHTALTEPLTDREMDVLQLLSAGFSNQQIADELVITEDTVKRHNTHIYGKLNVSNRTQAVLRAQELGLL